MLIRYGCQIIVYAIKMSIKKARNIEKFTIAAQKKKEDTLSLPNILSCTRRYLTWEREPCATKELRDFEAFS